MPPGLTTAPATARSRRGWRFGDFLAGRGLTLVIAILALAASVSTFIILTRGSPFGLDPGAGIGLLAGNVAVLLALGAVLAGRLRRVWLERRRGSAGARLHVRLVLLFGGVAVAPSLVVALFAVLFFHLGVRAWFDQPVRDALAESREVARGYLDEHRDNIRSVALEMANDLARVGQFLAIDPNDYVTILAQQTALRGLTEAVIYEPVTGQVYASAGLLAGLGTELPAEAATERAMRSGDVVVLDDGDNARVRAIVRLESQFGMMLLVGRPVDPTILDHMAETERIVADYQRMDRHKSGLQLAFAWIFASVTLLVLGAAILIGLLLANQIARPIGRLMQAADRARSGDLSGRVREDASHDEIAALARAFNRMTEQLGAQRAELMDAYGQIDERRRFTESVLSGVSAGVIGLDAQGRIELPNRAAGELLGSDLWDAIGRELPEVVPEFGGLLASVRARPQGVLAEIAIGPAARRRVLMARAVADTRDGHVDGYVVTFDDITELQAAQRQAAWADVARRIAHEIKNPLTPIQLSAERLKRRFTKEITSDPDTFAQCADTIVRHVGDIGRMVDEFSRFARMPAPRMAAEDVGRLAREVFVLRKTARPDLRWSNDIPERGPVASCDGRLLREALTNLLQNAEDAVDMPREDAGRAEGEAGGHIDVRVSVESGAVVLAVSDDGVGLPEQNRDKLTEPYVTHKPKGTGLGLAIVKKIMEDHGGQVRLRDRPGARGAEASLVLPRRVAGDGMAEDGAAGVADAA